MKGMQKWGVVALLSSLAVSSSAFAAEAVAEPGAEPGVEPVRDDSTEPGQREAASVDPSPDLTAQGNEQFEDREDKRQFTLGFGMNFYRFDYAEDVALPLKSTEKGVVPAFRIGMDIAPQQSPWFFQGDVELGLGKTSYDGSTQGGSALTSQTKNGFVAIDASAAYRIVSFTDLTSLHLYLGISAQAWIRDGSAYTASNGTTGYRETYILPTYPIGIRLETGTGDRLSGGLDLSARPMLGGKMTLRGSDIHPELADAEVNLGASIGYRVQLPVRYRLSKKLGVSMIPWFEYSSIGRSNTVTLKTTGGAVVTDNSGNSIGVTEPASRTYRYGSALMMSLDL